MDCITTVEQTGRPATRPAGGRVEVLAPPPVRQRLAAIAEEIAGLYADRAG